MYGFFVRVLFRRSTSWNKKWTETPGTQKSGTPACSVYCGLWRLVFVNSQNETWFHITILAHRIVRRRLDFWKICIPLDYTVGLPRNSRPHAKAVQKFSDCAHNLVLSCSKLRSIQLYKNVVVPFCNILYAHLLTTTSPTWNLPFVLLQSAVLLYVCGWVVVVSVWQASACHTDTTTTQPHRNSNTHRNKNTRPMWWYNRKVAGSWWWMY